MEGVKVGNVERGGLVLHQPTSYVGLSCFGQVKPGWMNPQPKDEGAAGRHALVRARGTQSTPSISPGPLARIPWLRMVGHDKRVPAVEGEGCGNPCKTLSRGTGTVIDMGSDLASAQYF